MKRDGDESLHAADFDPVRESLLSATRTDWDWLVGCLEGADDEHSRGWLATLKEVREGLNHAAPTKPAISGYRKLPDDVLNSINRFKEMEERLMRVIDGLGELPTVHQRWLWKGRDHLEIAFMLLVRSLAQPERVKLPED